MPENVDLESTPGSADTPDDLRTVLDEIKASLTGPRPFEKDMAEAVKTLSRIASSVGASNGHSSGGPKLRLGIFVDTANLTDRDPEDPIRLDFAKLREHVTADRRLIHARAYCPVYADHGGRTEHQRSVALVWGKGYDIVTKPIKVFADGTRKADLDIVLVMDVIRRLPTMDVAALMSGDGDYVPMVEFLRERGLRVEVYSFADAISEDLRLAADEWIDVSAMKALHLKGREVAAPAHRRAGAPALAAG
ncbi:MAG: NYN domain-containing protein [Actinobacteria bacterium]|nr:NYN domain-containing protein [Actinomycetota bacterium]